MPDVGLTEQQRKWMASVRASLEAKTGKTFEHWVEVARTCPETAPRARQRWFKETHGLGQNYAAVVLEEQAQIDGVSTRAPDDMRGALWSDPDAAAILAALEVAVAELPDLVTGQRKAFTSWSRKFAFAVARPAKGGVRLGLALDPGANPRLLAPSNEGWSERLKSTAALGAPDQVDAELKALLRAAWEAS